jgi:hypothetical protein
MACSGQRAVIAEMRPDAVLHDELFTGTATADYRRGHMMAMPPSWDTVYAPGAATPPWDIGRPQPALLRLADRGLPSGRLVDEGCDTGEHALLATARAEAIGVDIFPCAIARAREKAARRGLPTCFEVADVLSLGQLGMRFDMRIDGSQRSYRACHDCYSCERKRRERCRKLRSVTRIGGSGCYSALPASQRVTKVPRLLGSGLAGEQRPQPGRVVGVERHRPPVVPAVVRVRSLPDGPPSVEGRYPDVPAGELALDLPGVLGRLVPGHDSSSVTDWLRGTRFSA